MTRMNRKPKKFESGFSLVELMVAMAVFTIIGAAAFTLVRRHIPLFANQQNQAGLNITLRNAASQIQIDAVNAGTGYYAGSSVAAFPVGLTVVNSNAGSGCYNSTTKTYGATCFDTLNIIATDQTTNMVPASPSGAANGTGCVDLSASTTLYATPSGTVTPAQLSALYKSGNKLLLIKNDGSQMTRIDLSADSTWSGTTVRLTHPAIAATGVYTGDTLNIATTNVAANGVLGAQFCPGDWVLKLSPVTYQVDATDNTNPKLVRTQNGVSNVIAEQVIGFKVGVSTWTGADTSAYTYDTSTYNSNWANLRSVRVSLIGRSVANPDGNFQNSFDGGNYKVEAVSVVVNPRNLSMND